MNNRLSFLPAVLALLSIAPGFAATVIERHDILNNLWNSTASVPGLTGVPIKVDFKVGSTTCSSQILPFQTGTTLLVGGGLPCATSITSIIVTPQSAALIGAVYGTTPITITPTAAKFSHQYVVYQDATNGTAPIFNTNDGTIATPGVPAAIEQVKALW